jgi:hypothetical protein
MSREDRGAQVAVASYTPQPVSVKQSRQPT